MSDNTTLSNKPYEMKFDVGTIKHLGLQMYSTLPPVIGELVANGWDANATKVEITIPDEPINERTSEIVITDNGDGMSDEDVREKYLRIGRDRRETEQSDETRLNRKIMGRKGIGKFSAFGIAKEIVIESVKEDRTSHFAINYDELLDKEDERIIELPPLPATGDVNEGTKVTLRYITKFKNRRISIGTIRRGLARRFAVIGQHDFEVVINGLPISPVDRDLKRWLDKDMDDKPYRWEYEDEEIKPDTGWTVSGWIGALKRTNSEDDGIDRGIVLMARGKLVQEPFIFNAVVGQQFALSYLIGELHVDFVDEEEDTIGTTRNSLVWDIDANATLLEWGKEEVQKIAREWSDRRGADNEKKLQENELYRKFQEQAGKIDKKREFKQADKLVRQMIRQALDKNPTADVEQFESIIQMFLDFWEFDSFREMAADLTEVDLQNTEKMIELFREWEILESKEMARITEGRITTIEKLQNLIDSNALEVPTLHDYLKEFPWVIDPRWTMVDDEVTYSKLLNDNFPIKADEPEENKRIDFLCVRESTNLVVVEIKRPQSRASRKEIDQIEEYVLFMKDYVKRTSDPDYRLKEVTGYLLCGDLVDTPYVREKREILEGAQIYIRRYSDLLGMVERAHTEFLKRYNQLRAAKQNVANHSDF